MCYCSEVLPAKNLSGPPVLNADNLSHQEMAPDSSPLEGSTLEGSTLEVWVLVCTECGEDLMEQSIVATVGSDSDVLQGSESWGLSCLPDLKEKMELPENDDDEMPAQPYQDPPWSPVAAAEGYLRHSGFHLCAELDASALFPIPSGDTTTISLTTSWEDMRPVDQVDEDDNSNTHFAGVQGIFWFAW